MWETLEICAQKMKLTDLILILQVKRLQAVINGNKPEMYETGSETEIKKNGGKSNCLKTKRFYTIYWTYYGFSRWWQWKLLLNQILT